MAAVAQRSMALQPGAPQLCAARPDPFQQALIVCPPGFQGKKKKEFACVTRKKFLQTGLTRVASGLFELSGQILWRYSVQGTDATLFDDIFGSYALFTPRAAGITFQAHQLLCADGECCSHSDAGPWCPASADPAWPPYAGKEQKSLLKGEQIKSPQILKNNRASQESV